MIHKTRIKPSSDCVRGFAYGLYLAKANTIKEKFYASQSI